MKTNKTKLFLSCGALALLGALALQGCSSSSDDTASGGTGGTGTAGTGTGGKGGTSAGGTSAGGTSAGGKGGTGTGGTGTAGTGTGGTSAAGSPAEGGAGGEATAMHPTATECTDFCSLDASTCTGGNAAYASTGECQTACMAYALGDDSDPTHMAATAGDNFACRAYHLQNAIKNAGNAGMLTFHCGHTGQVSTACF